MLYAGPLVDVGRSAEFLSVDARASMADQCGRMESTLERIEMSLRWDVCFGSTPLVDDRELLCLVAVEHDSFGC